MKNLYSIINDKFRIGVALLLLIAVGPVFAEDTGQSTVWTRAQDSLAKTWDSKDYELYIPVNTWHNRNYYSREQIDSYNENPWGLGLGKYRYDNDGNWHALYVMAFKDSHNQIEPIAGYGFQKIWRPYEDFRLGVGYTLGVTMRQDMDYLPIPVLAPIASVAYKQLALQSTYIIGGKGNGNILFTWFRWQL